MTLSRWVLAGVLVAAVGGTISAVDGGPPRNDLPQPYRTTRDWGELPASIPKWPAVSAVEVARDGTIYVVERCFQNSCEGRAEPPILKYNAEGKLLKAWGEGMFNFPHGAALDAQGNLWVTDARGRLFVGDRENNRIQIFDQDGTYLDAWRQFGRPSGIYITADDTIYVADSESGPDTGAHELMGIRKGIRIGSARDGTVTSFIEDLESTRGDHSGAEGLGVDAQGNVYGAVVRRQMLERHVRK